MSSTILVTSKFLKPIPGHHVSTKHKKAIKDFITRHNPNGYSVSPDIEGLLLKLNTVKSYDEIPDMISISYLDLISRGIDLKDTFDVIRLTSRLAANRFNEKPKEILMTGHVGLRSLAVSDCKKLISAGFVGCTLSPLVHGIEASEESAYCNKKDPYHWTPLATEGKVVIETQVLTPLEITLTFRQEQILKMVCEKGMTNYQIAKRLDLSESTVKMHIGIVFKKYGVRDRSQLIFSLKEKIG
jgi:DNA-binding CsgD family transcriptional regulator